MKVVKVLMAFFVKALLDFYTIFLPDLPVLKSTLVLNECSRNLKWLHVPKTSSTFCLTIQHICCNEYFNELSNKTYHQVITYNYSYERRFLFRNISNLPRANHGCMLLPSSNISSCNLPYFDHIPLPKRQSLDISLNIFTILRIPKNRLVSAFVDYCHREGMNYRYWNEFLNKTTETIVREFDGNISNSLRTVDQSRSDILLFILSRNALKTKDEREERAILKFAEIYANEPATIGCQTKMILGYKCAQPVNITQGLVQSAIRRLHTLKFVGIFERYNESVAQFHRIMKMNTTTHPLELLKFRSSPNIELKKKINIILSSYYDPFDEQIYQEGLKIFEQRESKQPIVL